MLKRTVSAALSLLIIIGSLVVFEAAADTQNILEVPRITFTTENGNGTSLLKSDGYVNAEVQIEDVDGSILSDSIIMKVRGNSSAFDSIAKKSYNFKFEKKKNVLNMGSGKKWSLISNIFDPTLARNYVAFSLAKELGVPYTSEFKVVEVVVDGSFRGCYLLIEPVGDGKDRVDIDVKGNDGKKDFLLELEALREESDVTYFTTNGIRFAVSEPDPPSEDQVTYMRSTMDDVISTLKNGTKEEIESKIDVSSFVKFYLLNEFLKTVDFDFSSLYYYYKDGRLCAGPPWDYDLSTGNVNENFSARYASSYKTDGLFISGFNLFKILCAKDWFNELTKAEFAEHYAYFAAIPAKGGVIDSFYNTYETVIKRNFNEAGWRVNRYYVNVMKTPLNTFEENWDFYVNWCAERVEWLREYFGVEPITTTEPVTETTEPSTETSEPVTGTTEPSTETSEPVTGTTEPVTGTSEPVTDTTEPSTETSEPVTGTTEPSTETSEPVTDTTEPVTGTLEPVTDTTEPVTGTSEPVTDTTEPVTGTSEPVTDTTAPVTETTEPMTETTEPVTYAIEPVKETLPKPKTKTTVNAGKKQVTLSVSPVQGATDYKIAYKKYGAKNWSYVYTGGQTTFVFSNLKSNGCYVFMTCAVNTAKSITSPWSNTSYRYISKTEQKKAIASKKSVKAFWKKNKYADGYQIIYSLKRSMRSNILVIVNKKTAVSYRVNNLKAHKKYYIRVRAYRIINGKKYTGEWSVIKSAKTK